MASCFIQTVTCKKRKLSLTGKEKLKRNSLCLESFSFAMKKLFLTYFLQLTFSESRKNTPDLALYIFSFI
jgi:hypothetical protein